MNYRKIVENFIGRELKSDEVVHHVNGNPKDNRIQNLRIMSSSDHAKLHRTGQRKTKKLIRSCYHLRNKQIHELKLLSEETGLSMAKMLNSQKLISKYNYDQDISLFDKFKSYDYSALAGLKISANRKEKIIMGIRVERSFLSIHEVYKLYNFDYGIELSYFF